MLPREPMTPWVLFPRPVPDRRVRLFCFPYAGAGASAFRTWARAMPAHVELALVQLPGREGRIAEPLHRRMTALADAAAVGIEGALTCGAPVAFFGHSMGALLAYETARRLTARGAGAPRLLVASGHRAPHLPPPGPPMHEMSDEMLLQELARLGGTPEAVLEHPELLALVRPIFRADLEACERYGHDGGAPLPCPIAAYGGLADSEAPPVSVEAWRAHTAAAFSRRLFPGGHFFLHTAEAAVLTALIRDLATIRATAP